MAECTPGEEYPYYPPSPSITQNITYPFDDIDEYPSWEIGLKIATYTVAMAMAIIGNAAVLLTMILHRRRVLSASMTVYLANLAVSDFMVGALIMWVHLISNIQQDWPFGAAVCKVYHFLQITFLTASVLFMANLALDRLLAVMWPMKWRLSRPWIHVVVVVVTWSVAIAVAVPILLVRERLELIWADRTQVWCDEQWPRYASEDQPDPDYCQYVYPERQIYYNCQVVLMYFIPVLVMIVAYGLILFKIKDRKTPGQQTDSTLAQQQQITQRVLRMLIVVLVAFIVCWTPQEVIVFMDANWPAYTDQYLSSDVRYAMIYIAYFNSSINPIIYAGLNERFRYAFKETFCRRRQQRRVTPVAADAGCDNNNNGAKNTESSKDNHVISQQNGIISKDVDVTEAETID